MANKVNKRFFGPTGGSPATLPIRFKTGGTVYEGYVVNQVGARRFKCADTDTVIQDENIVAGNQYVIVSIGGTDFTQFGALDNKVGRIFTATTNGAALGNGTVYQVVVGKLVQGTNMDPVNNGEATLVGLIDGSQPVTLSKINFRTAADFNGRRFKWSLSDDSSQTLIILTAI